MRKRFYLAVIVLAILLLALGGLVVCSTAALFRALRPPREVGDPLTATAPWTRIAPTPEKRSR